MCEYVQVPCVHSGCGELVTRANLVEHLEKSCQFRMEKCDYCQTLVEFAFLKVTITIKKFVFYPRVVVIWDTILLIRYFKP